MTARRRRTARFRRVLLRRDAHERENRLCGGTMDHEHDRKQLERLTFFSDAVFAIAITLLVIEVRPPHVSHHDNQALAQALVNLLPNYIGFVVSFLVLGRFWVVHHNVFGLLKAADHRLVWTNLLFLMVVAFMPFPTAVLSEYTGLRVGVGLYTAWLTLLGLMNRLVIRTALKNARLVHDDVEATTIATQLRNSWISITLGTVSFLLGMIMPVLAVAALVIGSPLIGYIVRRRALAPG